MPGVPNKSFTVDYDSIVNQLFTNVVMHHPLKPDQGKPDPNLPQFQCNAIWDTGATASMITQTASKALGLVPFSSTTVSGVHGTRDVPVYKIGLWLPNKVGFRTMNVTECESLNGPFEMLIGMDVINQGDMAVSHKNGHTFFSFRMPSQQAIDFTGKATAINEPVINSAKVGRNEPCPCHSGRKYKHCCGKNK